MSLPYFPMYPKDFEAKTSHLSLEEDGAYNRMLRIMWITPGCSIPNDAAWIMRRLRVDQATYERVVRPVIQEFFVFKAGRLFSPRLSEEWRKASDAHKKRVSAGSKGGNAKALKTKDTTRSNALAMLKQPEPEPYPETTSSFEAAEIDFKKFYEAHPRPGNIDATRLAFDELVANGTTPQLIVGSAIKYAGVARSFSSPNFVQRSDNFLSSDRGKWQDYATEEPERPQATQGDQEAFWAEKVKERRGFGLERMMADRLLEKGLVSEAELAAAAGYNG